MQKTEGIRSFLKPADLHRLGRLTLESRYVVEGNLAGRHRSPAKGSSSEFADHRAYTAGDDPKRLDWKVLGRTDRYYIRRYEDEANLRVYLVVDRSASMAFTSATETKYFYACRLATAIAHVVIKARDSVGLFLYSDKIDSKMSVRNSFVHLNNVARTLAQSKPGATTQTAKTLNQIAESIRRRALVALFSDLLDDPEEVIRTLAHFRKQHHDVIVFHVLDQAELDFPFRQAAQFVDMESGERIQADPRGLAAEYRRVFGKFLEQYRKPCAEMNIDYRLVKTNQEAITFMRSFLEERKRLAK